jgi:hypothetical protein
VEEVATSSGALYARKTFRPAAYIPTSAYDALRKRFKREVKIQEALGGQEVMPVLDAELDIPQPWFVMPLAEKSYDKQVLEDKRNGSVDVNAVADILNGLQFLHDLGYVHRDLNPKNILKHDGHWKLSDLGAVLPPAGHTVTLTENTVIYTEQYCSPEQRNDFHMAQAPADVFSLGCILHDIFGKLPRTPYSRQTATGPIGLIIEKCTEINPSRRPTIKVLRELLLETLVEMGGHCKVEDVQAESWLGKLADVGAWTDTEYGEFARFFAQLDIKERTPGEEVGWVYSLSTPFLTRLPAEALIQIVRRKDGVAGAVVEKYCEWAKTTDFLFHYADTVCERLSAIFDEGTPSDKAQALIAMIALGYSHNRWYVMRNALHRCSPEKTGEGIARRLAIEIRTEEMEYKLKRCLEATGAKPESLAPEIAKLCVAA